MKPYLVCRQAAELFGIALALGAAPAFAISDEIQVYTYEINKPREFGLELHVNTTPAGRSTQDYPGDSPPRHGLRFTPEFSYGLADDFEAGLYLPTVRDASGNFYSGGAKLRLKWLPVKPPDEQSGWFLGANFELSRNTKRFSESQLGTELRTIIGYRADKWLIGVNPILGYDLSPGFRGGGPEMTFAVKAMRDVAEGIALGIEYYDAIGKLANRLPSNLQEHTVYLVMDFDRKPWIFNVGVGRGMTGATDQWTVKAILEIPFN